MESVRRNFAQAANEITAVQAEIAPLQDQVVASDFLGSCKFAGVPGKCPLGAT